ncbi:MAG: DinB family protein [Chloroflexota bacterium]
MQLTDIRFLFDYDRWATRRVLDAAVGIDGATWSAADQIDERGLGGMLVHALGAYQRWRHGLAHEPGDAPRPEHGRLPSVAELRSAWETEWLAMDAWLASIDDATMGKDADGVPYWQALAHLANHGTQHRSEAAVLLTTADHSPGDLDMIDYAESLQGAGS